MAIKLNKSEEILYQALIDAGAIKFAKDFQNTGLPTRRVEEYHYSDLKMLLTDIPTISTSKKTTNKPVLDIASAYQISIINGGPKISANPPAGVTIRTDSGGISNKNDDVIIQLNSALTKETLIIETDNMLDQIIYIDRRSEDEASHINGAVEFSIMDNSSATIIEVFSGSNEAHFSNHATKLLLGKNAKATHVMVDLSYEKARHFQCVQYEIDESALLYSLIIHAGANLSRTQLFANFNGEKSHADFNGLILADNKKHSDITIDVRHNVAHTTSTENFKSVVKDDAKAIFQGKIIVARDAQKTDAKMMHQGLMLSDDAQVLVKPELEIYADDVICGHGATCGELDEISLFYLMSRGIEREQAKAMLVQAFLAELFDAIKDKTLQQNLVNIADDWLAKE